MQYKYVHVISGEVTAPNDESAKLQVLMGVSISSRLLDSPIDVGLELEQASDNGQREEPPPIRPAMEH